MPTNFKKKTLLLLLTLANSALSFGQLRDLGTPEQISRRVADRIIADTRYEFVNEKTGQISQSTQGLPVSEPLRVSFSLKWHYVNAVTSIGMMQLGAVLNEKKYTEFPQKNYDFIFNNLDFFKKQYDAGVKSEWDTFFRMNILDDAGAQAAPLAEIGKPEYRAYLDRAADYTMHKQIRFPDGTISRPDPHDMTVWADDLYMCVPLMVRMYKLTGDKKYLDDAIKQVENFNKYLYDPASGLFFHGYYSDVKMNNVAHWGRANGWVAMAQTELLNYLPKDHPKRPELIRLLLRQIVGFSRYQDPSGLWRQLLDKQDSYLETSVTAMFLYATARAVDEGWINPRYGWIVNYGWHGLAAKITADGQIEDVCVGTNLKEDIHYYYHRRKAFNDEHASGAVLLAGAEMIRFGQKGNPIKK